MEFPHLVTVMEKEDSNMNAWNRFIHLVAREVDELVLILRIRIRGETNHRADCDLLGLQIHSGAFVEAVGVRAVGRHHAVERGPAGCKPILFSLIATLYQPHKLTHTVS